MLNLSDKDLDRLSQEAAQQHEPQDVAGPKFWDKLEARLDRDLGKVNPNPTRGIRRLPYYYAPALLMLLGVTYYLVRPANSARKGTSSGSPPLTVVRPAPDEPLKPVSSSKNPVPSNNSNSTPTAPPSNTVQYPGTARASSGDAPAASSRTSPGAPANSNAGAPATFSTSTNLGTAAAGHRHHNKPDHLLNTPSSADKNDITKSRDNTTTSSRDNTTTSSPGNASPSSPGNTAPSSPAATRTPHDLTYSAVRGPVRLSRRGFIDDSALRAFNLATIRTPIHKDGLRVNRSLTIGIIGGPNESSVNSVAGNRLSSSFGLTVDYQFANHWYLGSGLLLSRINFAAAPQDYHVPTNYYSQTLMVMGGDVNYIKGTFDMIEVPLDLRYDFSAGNNALFFASVGASSYFSTSENCGYYYNWYNTSNIVDKHISYAHLPDNLFASVNLSVGAEVGISNSLSLLVAPYWKIPTRGIGFGQVQLSSFGLDFSLRLAPVLSRRR